ncbi:hypothetical protein WISP_87205 [Willisornis vidua]|uniref:Uncharacterized protein n=1 Tax=Willisornis vidua TaxID=1566151 RepID=A0ABQ9D345_9PASS|nr:hypothetical protein WISP_87205 [Willisornis vidua]
MTEGRDVIQKDLDRTEVGVCEPHEVQQGEVQRPAPGWGTPKHKHRMGGEWIENSPEQKDSGVLVDKKLNTSLQCVLAAQKAKCVPGCIKRSVASRSGEVILHLCSPFVRSWKECYVQLWGPQQKNMDMLE